MEKRSFAPIETEPKPPIFDKSRNLYEVAYVEDKEIGLNLIKSIFEVDRGRALLEYDKSGYMAIWLPELDKHNNYSYNDYLLLAPNWSLTRENGTSIDTNSPEVNDLTGLNIDTLMKAKEMIAQRKPIPLHTTKFEI
jgi:hypothetical protein